jgi:hypothetical protein
MKNLSISLLIIATIALTACSGKKEKAVEQKQTVTEITVQLEKGLVQVFDYGNFKLHAYTTKDLMNDVVIILEKDGKAAMIEGPAFWDNFDEFRNYIAENNIKIDGILPAYHPLGANFIETPALKDMDVYFTQNVIDYWDHGFGAVMKAGIPQAFGDNVDASFYVPTIMLEDGEVEIAGIKMIISNTFDGFDIEIPEFNAVYVHILGHDVHSEILGAEHLETSIEHFNKYLNKGYTTYLSSHYAPETKENMEEKVAYLIDMKKIVTESHTAEEFISKMKTSYPEYKEGYLLRTSKSFFSDEQVGHKH